MYLHGGLVNIVFGILLYFILVSMSSTFISTKIDSVVPNYAAEQVGLQAGDQIIKINDKKIRLKSDIDSIVQDSNGNEIKLTIRRNSEQKEIYIVPTKVEQKNIGIYLGAEDDNLTSKIKAIYPDSPAQSSGLKEEDIITKIDGIECENDPYKIVELITTNKNEKIEVEITRNGEAKTVEIIPQIQVSYKIGVTFGIVEKNFKNNVYYGFWDTIDFSTSIIDNLKMLFTGKIKADQLSRTNWNISSCIKNTGISRIYIFNFINIIIFRSNKFITISTT